MTFGDGIIVGPRMIEFSIELTVMTVKQYLTGVKKGM